MHNTSIPKKQTNSFHNNDIIYPFVFYKTSIYYRKSVLLTYHRVVVTSNISIYWLFLSKYYPTLLSPPPLTLFLSLSPLLVSVASITTFPFHLRVCVFLHICLCMCVGEQIYIHLYPSEKTADFRIHSFTSPTIFQQSLYHKFDVPFFYNKLPLTLYISEFMLPNT